jgi:hypothetical protein
MNWTETYFKWRVLSAIFRIVSAVISTVAMALLIMACLIFPNAACIVGGIGCVLYIIVALCHRLFVPRSVESKNAQLIRLGIVPNPPEGTNWFRPDGSKIEYDPATGRWR